MGISDPERAVASQQNVIRSGFRNQKLQDFWLEENSVVIKPGKGFTCHPPGRLFDVVTDFPAAAQPAYLIGEEAAAVTEDDL